MTKILSSQIKILCKHIEFEISYDITTSEKITEISAASIDLILKRYLLSISETICRRQEI